MSHRILIVEDNENNRGLFRDILTFHGYEVSVAADGREGVALARELMPDLILMDIQMPGMDGMTAIGILKGDPATSRLKIIALTSFAMRGDQEKFLGSGFDDYLSKPIDTRELPRIIKDHLSPASSYNPAEMAIDDGSVTIKQGGNMPGTILVIDDNIQNRTLLRDVLTHYGFAVLLAENGAEGVAAAGEHNPDLILMDIQMPGMNGLEAGRLLRSDSRTKNIKILALSCFNMLDDEDNFFATGFDGYIGKPFDIRELPKIIMKHLSEGERG